MARTAMLRWAIAAALCLVCQPANTQTAGAGQTMRGFASEEELDRFARRLHTAEQAVRRRNKRDYRTMARVELKQADVYEVGSADAAAAASDAAAPAYAGYTSYELLANVPGVITNNQERNVDEGGIVKATHDFLVVLRRGRLFTVRHGGGELSAIDRIDAFPPGKVNPGETWYDEMLISGDQVIVLGYSYSEQGTEVNRFRLSPDGRLTYRDTHYLASSDYYSSRNYASRLIGDMLVFYAPVQARWGNWREGLPKLIERGEGGAAGEGVPLVRPADFYVAEPLRDGRRDLDILHTVTRCDLSDGRFDCNATAVAGGWSREFYVARDAVYAWTESVRPFGIDDPDPTPGQLYRIPLDGGAPGAIAIDGGPIDQFSFREDRTEGVLRVVIRADSDGGAMWSSEVSSGDVGLLTLPLTAFGDGSEQVDPAAFRRLPGVDGWRFRNRFVGNWLLYSAYGYGDNATKPLLTAVPLGGGEPTQVRLVHAVSRLDMLGNDAVAVGSGSNGSLGFTAISLGDTARVENIYLLPAAGEAEERSHAFFYRPDPDSPDATSGTLGLPVAKRRPGRRAAFPGGSSVFFLRREARRFAPAGDLAANPETAADDNCTASCIDWYGNARPIFLGNRIFALMGYELVEGRLEDGRITELRRLDFAPPPGPADER